MIAGRDRVLNVVAAVESARDAHPALRRKLTPKILWQVLKDEGVELLRAPIRKHARVSGFDGHYVITISSNLPAREQWRYALHEYGHIRCGHLADHGEHVRNLAPCRRGDPREDEANLFGMLLTLGPEATVEHPDAQPIADRIVARAIRAKLPAQLPLELPAAPRVTPATAPDPDPRGPQLRRRGKPHPALRWSTISRGISHDAMRLDWSREGKPLRFFDLELGWLDVYDYRAIETPTGQRKPQLLRFGDSRVEIRLFVLSEKDRRRYTFHPLERRRRTVKDLEAQVRAAVHVAPARPSGTSARPERAPRKEDLER